MLPWSADAVRNKPIMMMKTVDRKPIALVSVYSSKSFRKGSTSLPSTLSAI